jgi:predicted enzyme related to lactoylglutathione lyase
MNQSSNFFYVKVGQLEDAAAFFKDRLGMRIEEDLFLDQEKCILVKPDAETQIYLSKKKKKNQTNQITLRTEDCLENYCRLKAMGITFKKAPCYLNEGLCAVFSDPFGNDYTLLEQRSYNDFNV